MAVGLCVRQGIGYGCGPVCETGDRVGLWVFVRDRGLGMAVGLCVRRGIGYGCGPVCETGDWVWLWVCV